MSDNSGQDDPWAKWRKPEAPAAVEAEAKPKAKPVEPVKPAAPVDVVAPVEASVKPEGTLGVRKSAMPADRPLNRRPIRGGAVQKRATMADKVAIAERLSDKPARPSSAKMRGDAPRENPWKKAAPVQPSRAPAVAAKPLGPSPEGVQAFQGDVGAWHVFAPRG